MNGLTLTKAYYEDACLPILTERLPESLSRMAVGLVGEGSECFGWDDAISRDHSWGLRLCFWLTSEDFFEMGEELRGVVEQFPREFMGYSVQSFCKHEGVRSGVQEIPTFYRTLIGLPKAPQTVDEWMRMTEVKLAAACNGEIFLDQRGVFTSIRLELLGYYPKDVWLRRLAEHAAVAAQTGQYNLSRSFLRKDIFTAERIKSTFLEHVLAMVYLLNRRYRPFYKWAFRGLSDLPLLSQELGPLMNALSEEQCAHQSCALAEEISYVLISELHRQRLSESSSDFLMEHCGELLRSVEDSTLAQSPISLSF